MYKEWAGTGCESRGKNVCDRTACTKAPRKERTVGVYEELIAGQSDWNSVNIHRREP